MRSKADLFGPQALPRLSETLARPPPPAYVAHIKTIHTADQQQASGPRKSARRTECGHVFLTTETQRDEHAFVASTELTEVGGSLGGLA